MRAFLRSTPWPRFQMATGSDSVPLRAVPHGTFGEMADAFVIREGWSALAARHVFSVARWKIVGPSVRLIASAPGAISAPRFALNKRSSDAGE
jgi:hypothetical protein